MKRSLAVILSCLCALMLASFSLTACRGGDASSSSGAQAGSSASASSDGIDDPGDITADNLSTDDVRGVFEQAVAGMSEYYKGTTPVGEQLYYAGGADGQNAIFVLIVPETSVSAIFIGTATVGEDNTLSVTDDTTGSVISFQVFDNGDDTYSFSMGDEYGSAVMSRCSATEIVDALTAVVMSSAGVDAGAEGDDSQSQE